MKAEAVLSAAAVALLVFVSLPKDLAMVAWVVLVANAVTLAQQAWWVLRRD